MEQQEAYGLLRDSKACYAAMKSHDARFDGKFFCGVSSTGIYCRPICRVRLPHEKNCTFFASAAAAEAAGYRPCLRCRPELAPGSAPPDSSPLLAHRAVKVMEEDSLNSRSIPDLAEDLGISDRHLRRLFYNEYGVSPVQYMLTRRLLLAKNLLTDSRLAVTDVALAAGFGSIRRFNDLFKKRYRLTPSMLRNNYRELSSGNEEITLSAGYRPPYAWESLLFFLAARAIPGVESVENGVYRRTVSIKKGSTIYSGWIGVSNRPKKSVLLISLGPSLFPVLPIVLSRIRRLFDIDCSPDEIYEKLVAMNRLKPNIFLPGIRLPGCFDSFEISVRAILGQQVSVQAANTLAKRLTATYGEKIATPFAGLSHTFPHPEKISALFPIENHLGPLGITGAKSRSILALAHAVNNGLVSLSYGSDPHREMEKLRRLPGIGPWTAQYIAMRALGWPDAFPHTDLGIRKALPGLDHETILHLSREWSPWRSYATITLWGSLGKDRLN